LFKVLDTTLREGEQTPAVCFSAHIKLAIADLLDKIGVDIIEAGHPIVSPEIAQTVKRIARRALHSVVGAHARSVEKDIDMALEAGVGFLGVLYCVSAERLERVFKQDLQAAQAQIGKIIAYAKSQSPDILLRFTLEDGGRTSFENVVSASMAAIEAGADIISVADTTGSMVPGSKNSMFAFIDKLKDVFDKYGASPLLAVHCHNDRGFALANALEGLRAGAEIVDASVLGLGERAGIVDLSQLLLTKALDFERNDTINLKYLPELYTLVSEHSGVQVPVHFPIVGKNAFTHCAGVHTHAVMEDQMHYQSFSPELVDRKMCIALDQMSGLSSVKWALEQIQVEPEIGLAKRVLGVVKQTGHRGKSVNLSELRYIVDWCNEQADN